VCASVLRTTLPGAADNPRKGAAHDMDSSNHADAATHAGQPSTGAARRTASSWRVALVGLVLIPVILACTQSVRLDKAPATILRLELHFAHALVPGPTTEVTLSTFTDPNNYVEAFTGGQTLSIDGVTLGLHGTTTIPRQKPGGVGFYTLIYTDENGKQTVAHIPAPREDLAITQPTANSRVPLPRRVGAGSKKPAATPTPNNDPSNPYQARPPQFADAPLTLHYSLPYLPESLLPDPYNRNRYEVGVSVDAPCAPAWPGCLSPLQYGLPTSPPTGTATIDDSTWPWGRGFETRAPGPGQLSLSMNASWSVPDSGFGYLTLDFEDNSVNVPITWV
jgi:hypothetical protein